MFFPPHLSIRLLGVIDADCRPLFFASFDAEYTGSLDVLSLQQRIRLYGCSNVRVTDLQFVCCHQVLPVSADFADQFIELGHRKT